MQTLPLDTSADSASLVAPTVLGMGDRPDGPSMSPRSVRRARPGRASAPGVPGVLRQHLRAVIRRVNKSTADLGLSFFFWHARRQPWFARGTKPFFLYFVWRFSEHLYGGTMANARRILGEDSTVAQREKLARQIIDNFYDFVCDVGLAMGLSRQQLLDRIDQIEGVPLYESVRKSGPTAGRGAIILTAHMGSFEVGAAALMQRERRMHVLFRRDKLNLFEQIRSSLRKKLGVNEVPVDEGWTVWIRLRDALARDEVVLIQGDRVMPGQKGQAVKFFEGHILLPTGPVRLAVLSGAPIIPVFSIRTHAGLTRLFVDQPIIIGDGPGGVSPDEGMQRVAAVLEKYVRRFPSQWLENRPAWIEDKDQPLPPPSGKKRLERLLKRQVRVGDLSGGAPRR